MITLMAMTEVTPTMWDSMVAVLRSIPNVREGTTRKGGMCLAKRMPEITVGVIWVTHQKFKTGWQRPLIYAYRIKQMLVSKTKPPKTPSANITEGPQNTSYLPLNCKVFFSQKRKSVRQSDIMAKAMTTMISWKKNFKTLTALTILKNHGSSSLWVVNRESIFEGWVYPRFSLTKI